MVKDPTEEKHTGMRAIIPAVEAELKAHVVFGEMILTSLMGLASLAECSFYESVMTVLGTA